MCPSLPIRWCSSGSLLVLSSPYHRPTTLLRRYDNDAHALYPGARPARSPDYAPALTQRLHDRPFAPPRDCPQPRYRLHNRVDLDGSDVSEGPGHTGGAGLPRPSSLPYTATVTRSEL